MKRKQNKTEPTTTERKILHKMEQDLDNNNVEPLYNLYDCISTALFFSI